MCIGLVYNQEQNKKSLAHELRHIANGDFDKWDVGEIEKGNHLYDFMGGIKMDNKKKHFWDSQWFLWFSLIFIYPVGLLLLWFNTDCDKKYKKIMSVVFGILFVLLVTNPFSGHKENNAQQPDTSSITTVDNTSAIQQVDKNKNTRSYMEIAEQEISKVTGDKVVDMNLLDNYQHDFPNGLTVKKGTFNKDGIKHEWRIEFITETHEPVLFKIDGQTIYFLEDKRDAVIDAYIEKEKKQHKPSDDF